MNARFAFSGRGHKRLIGTPQTVPLTDHRSEDKATRIEPTCPKAGHKSLLASPTEREVPCLFPELQRVLLWERDLPSYPVDVIAADRRGHLERPRTGCDDRSDCKDLGGAFVDRQIEIAGRAGSTRRKTKGPHS